MASQLTISRGAVAALLAALACLAGPVTGAGAQAPDTTIDSGPTQGRTPEFTFSSLPPGATFECRHHRTDAIAPSFVGCASPHTLPALGDGEWAFEVRAVGAGGFRDLTPARRVFTIELAAPDTTITSPPVGLTSNTTPQFNFSSTEDGTFECWIHRPGDTVPNFGSCTTPHTVLPALTDGTWVFDVAAIDTANKRDPVAATETFAVDTTPPETTITGGPGDTTAATAVFLFSAPGAARFSCRLDGGTWQPCSSPHTYPTVGLGPHGFEVSAVDAAGNEDPTPAQHTWQVLRPGRVIPGAVEQATALVKELVQMRRALARIRLRTLARRKAILLRTYDALTAGRVAVRARTPVRRGRSRRWIGVLTGRREVPDAGRHRIRARVTKKGRRLARSRRALPLELRLSITDLAGRSLSATSKLTLRR